MGGIPAVYHGVNQTTAHSDDEHVVVADLTRAARVYAATILRYLNTRDTGPGRGRPSMTGREPSPRENVVADEWHSTRLFMRRPWLDDLPPFPSLSEDYVLRRGVHADLPALATLLTCAFDEVWDEERVRRTLLDAPDVEATYVVARGDLLVATASARLMPEHYPGSGYLHWVGADPTHHGKGLGMLVNLRVLQHFQEAGLRDAVLETQDFRVAAVRSYLRIGFVPEYHYGDAGETLRWARLLPRIVR